MITLIIRCLHQNRVKWWWRAPRGCFAAALGLAATAAHAGYYTASYDLSDCYVDIVGPYGTQWSKSYTVSSGVVSGSGVSEELVTDGEEEWYAIGQGSVHVHGGIAVTFTWHGDDAGDVAPPCAIIREDSAASWGGTSGSASDDLGDSPSGGTYGQSVGGHLYWIKTGAGSSFTVHEYPEAQATCTTPGPGQPPNASAGITFSVTASPLRLSLSGTIHHTDEDLDECLIGQAISAAPTVDSDGKMFSDSWDYSSCTWTIAGSIFKSWGYASDYSSGGPVSLSSGDYTAKVPGWCWNNAATLGSKSVTGAMTITIDGHNFSVSLERDATVVRPTGYDLTGTHGGVFYDLYTIATGDGDTEAGMDFTAWCNCPSPFLATEGNGHWMFLQLTDLEIEVLFPAASPYELHLDGYWLDDSVAYDEVLPGGLHPCGVDNVAGGGDASDSPDVPLLSGTSYTIGSSWQMYLMFLPPGSGSQWVPLRRLDWTWTNNGSRSTPFVTWSDLEGPGVQAGSSYDVYVHPSWTQKYSP